MFDRARQAGIRVVAGTIVPYNTATPDQNARMREINDWIRLQAASTAGLAFADTRAAVAAPGKPDTLSETVDQLHPTPAGYRAMAEAIRPAMPSRNSGNSFGSIPPSPATTTPRRGWTTRMPAAAAGAAAASHASQTSARKPDPLDAVSARISSQRLP